MHELRTLSMYALEMKCISPYFVPSSRGVGISRRTVLTRTGVGADRSKCTRSIRFLAVWGVGIVGNGRMREACSGASSGTCWYQVGSTTEKVITKRCLYIVES